MSPVTISGSKANSDLYVTGGTTTLTAQNTYNGPTWVYGGGVLVNGNASGALPNTTTLILGGADNSNGAFDLNGNNQTVAGLSSQGAGTANIVTNNGANSAALVINGTGGTFAGSIQDGASATSLTVQSGNQILNGTNTYTGDTLVLGGTLGINGLLGNSAVSVRNGATLVGSGTASGSVTVNNGSVHGTGLNLGATTFMGSNSLSGVTTATSYTIASGSTSLSGTAKGAVSVSAGAILGNSGVIKGNTTVSGLLEGTGTIDGSLSLTSGVLAPGNSAGITTITGNFAMDNQSTLALGISGTTGAGIDYDQVRVAGAVSLAGTLNLTTLSGLTKAGESITLILNTSNTTLAIDGTFSSIEVDGVTQTVTNNTFSVGNMEYQIRYNVNGGATGIANDVVLTVVPEPATWALIAGGVGMLTFGQRIRRRLI